MKPRIDLITILTDNFETMKSFYRDVVGFEVELELEKYTEFRNEGVRFALCTRQVLANTTGHESFRDQRTGQSFELAFPAETPDEVDKVYQELTAKGATSIKAPSDMPWNQRTAFFADPDGNIHEIFAALDEE